MDPFQPNRSEPRVSFRGEGATIVSGDGLHVLSGCMNAVEQNLALWKASLVQTIPVAGLLSRDSLVYKWKAPFRTWMIREATSWRLYDLLAQSYALHRQDHGLGARILLRSGFETLATLIHLNQTIVRVLEGTLDFFAFGEKTSKLLSGSRDQSTNYRSINIVTILEKCDERYPGLAKLYATLSECAHPNYEGLVGGYSKIDHSLYETHFLNRWMALYGDSHPGSIELCMETFHYEYDVVWSELIEKLEHWIRMNDAQLEANRKRDT